MRVVVVVVGAPSSSSGSDRQRRGTTTRTMMMMMMRWDDGTKNKEKAEMSSVAKPDGKTLGNSLKMNVQILIA